MIDMEKGKQLINILHSFFKVVFYVNMVIGIGIIVLQIINLLIPKFEFAFSYFGKFEIELKQAVVSTPYNIFIDTITGSPNIVINSVSHKWWVLGFTLALIMVTLAYNHLLVKIFYSLKASIKNNTPFSIQIKNYLHKISVLSFGVFVVGSVLSIIKLFVLSEMHYHTLIVKPVFDNGLFNFLWLGIGFYILNEVYKVGVQLKNEHELTI